jgi:diaminobutyrate acetyltransferase
MEELNIRNTLEEDFVEIAELAENCSPMEIERNSIYHIFTKFFKSTSFVAEFPSGEIAGFILGFISQENPEESYIHMLCTDPKIRGKGIGRKLVEKFLNTSALKGCKKVYLIVKPINWNSISFYRKLGFLEDKSRDTMNIMGATAIRNYDGMGEHMVVFYKLLE